jgi:uncharacterized protein YdcH (DUF465 family)
MIKKIKTFWSFYKNYKNQDYKQLLDQYEGLKHHWELTKQEQEKKWKLEYEELEKSRSSLYNEISSIFKDYLVTLYSEKLDNIQKLKGK